MAVVEGLGQSRQTALLAEQVLGWTVTPERFMTGGGSWIPRWRFQPFDRLPDALRLLARLGPNEFSVKQLTKNDHQARVTVGTQTGEARERTAAKALATAITRALRMELSK